MWHAHVHIGVSVCVVTSYLPQQGTSYAKSWKLLQNCISAGRDSPNALGQRTVTSEIPESDIPWPHDMNLNTLGTNMSVENVRCPSLEQCNPARAKGRSGTLLMPGNL